MNLDQWSPYAVLGMNPGNQQRTMSPAGEALPASSHTGGDRGALPWHPDSPAFWLALLGGATLLGIFGASFGVRAGPAKGSVSVGKS
ncbi:MAG: hypothetical protein JWP34_4560 [Massilia sp.]|nr:hypothetical protein [Gemmatimonadales bacterium]MDB5910446.1 hypothetical protein [Massilia sp.]